MTMTPRATRLWMSLALAGLAGCTSWYSYQPAPSAEQHPEKVKVWQGGQAFELLGATVERDSLVGTRMADPGVPAARVAVPVVGIDSMFVRRVDPGKTGLLVLGALPAAFAMLFVIDGWLD